MSGGVSTRLQQAQELGRNWDPGSGIEIWYLGWTELAESASSIQNRPKVEEDVRFLSLPAVLGGMRIGDSTKKLRSQAPGWQPGTVAQPGRNGWRKVEASEVRQTPVDVVLSLHANRFQRCQEVSPAAARSFSVCRSHQPDGSYYQVAVPGRSSRLSSGGIWQQEWHPFVVFPPPNPRGSSGTSGTLGASWQLGVERRRPDTGNRCG